MQCGDTSAVGDGTGGKSIYSEGDPIHSKDGLFEDENVWFPHSHKGTISTHPNEKIKNSNGSQFMINFRDDNQYFDEKNTVFGRIIAGYDTIVHFQSIPRNEEKPIKPVLITNCGELRFDDKLKEDEAVDLRLYEVSE